MDYDAIVVGSRVAGAATSMLLARSGHHVLMVDRMTFPSDTISTHIVWQQGVSRLMEWGLGGRLASLGAPPLETVVFDVGPFALVGKPPAVGGAASAYAPRRTVLDSMLIEAASDAGVEVRHGFTVDELLFEGDRVTGVRGHSKSGSSVEERARVVIGADGLHSTVARMVQAQEYNVQPRLACWYYSYWSGLRMDSLRLFSRPGSAFGCIPTNDGLACLIVAWPQEQFSEVKRDIERHHLAAFDVAPAFKEEVMSGKREERFYGTGDVQNYFRKPYGDGWALVGDAGYHKDPILAQGISDAFRDASLLAKAIDDVLTGRATWESALADYESSRNTAVDAIYQMNAQYASLEPPPPDVQALMAALQGNAEDTGQWIGTMTGAVAVNEFYAPGNVQRILRSSSSRAHAPSC
jgi:flavin-dependent dehydrogenase